MKNVEFEEDEAIIKLNRDIYPESSVESTVDVFSEKFDVKTEKTGGKITVKISSLGGVETEKVGYRFLNYLLSEIKKNG